MVVGGILVPLIIEIGELGEKLRGTVAVPLLVLIGGLAFRVIFVMAGQLSSYTLHM